MYSFRGEEIIKWIRLYEFGILVFLYGILELDFCFCIWVDIVYKFILYVRIDGLSWCGVGLFILRGNVCSLFGIFLKCLVINICVWGMKFLRISLVKKFMLINNLRGK